MEKSNFGSDQSFYMPPSPLPTYPIRLPFTLLLSLTPSRKVPTVPLIQFTVSEVGPDHNRERTVTGPCEGFAIFCKFKLKWTYAAEDESFVPPSFQRSSHWDYVSEFTTYHAEEDQKSFWLPSRFFEEGQSTSQK